MSGRKILDDMKDAIAFAKGNKSRGELIRCEVFTIKDQDELVTRLAERDSVNTPWDKPANPNAEKLLWGENRKKK